MSSTSSGSFQSSPAARGGRNASLSERMEPCFCFNPRPLHAAGATRCSRARPGAGRRFNPRPLHAAGATSSSMVAIYRSSVSILARCTRRAQHHPGGTLPTVFEFQSSPAARGGRNLLNALLHEAVLEFQSSPAARGGRNTHEHAALIVVDDVSILARCTRRAQRRHAAHRLPIVEVSILARCTRRAQRVQLTEPKLSEQFQSSPAARGGRNSLRPGRPDSRSWCFNPRPLHAAGATKYKWRKASSKRVSILARCTRRAQLAPVRVLFVVGAFQSSPAARGGRNCASGRRGHAMAAFQSSPAARGGRNTVGPGTRRVAEGFNPRPLHAAGATYVFRLAAVPMLVSILARCTRRAQRGGERRTEGDYLVSILARCTRRAQPPISGLMT